MIGLLLSQLLISPSEQPLVNQWIDQKTHSVYSLTPGKNEHNYLLKSVVNHGIEETTILERFPDGQPIDIDSLNRKYENLVFSRFENRAKPTEMRDSRVSKDEVLWEATHEWNDEQELKFSDFVRDNANSEFLTKNNIKVDCADLAVVFRWIFARIHHLPSANISMTGQYYITHRTVKKEWLNLKKHEEWNKDERFFAALNFLRDSTYTHTVVRDLYPFKITLENLRPGIVNLFVRTRSGHTTLVTKFLHESHTNPVSIVYASEPEDSKLFQAGTAYAMNATKPERGGYFHYRQAIKDGDQYRLKTDKEIPNFSMQQYSPEFLNHKYKNFYFNALDLLGITTDFKTVYLGYVQAYADLLKERVDIVNKGYLICKTEDCSPGTQNYENWSTPARDQRLDEMSDEVLSQSDFLSNLIKDHDEYIKLTSIYYERCFLRFKHKSSLFQYDDHYKARRAAVYWIDLNDKKTYDPRYSVAQRWVIHPDQADIGSGEGCEFEYDPRKSALVYPVNGK